MGYWIDGETSERFDKGRIEDVLMDEFTNTEFDRWLDRTYKASDIIRMLERNGQNPVFDLAIWDDFTGEMLDSINIEEGKDIRTRTKQFIWIDDRKRRPIQRGRR